MIQTETLKMGIRNIEAHLNYIVKEVAGCLEQLNAMKELIKDIEDLMENE